MTPAGAGPPSSARGPADVQTGAPTRVDEFMPLQVPDAVEDPPADLARMNVPETRRKPQGGPAASGRLQQVHLS